MGGGALPREHCLSGCRRQLTDSRVCERERERERVHNRDFGCIGFWGWMFYARGASNLVWKGRPKPTAKKATIEVGITTNNIPFWSFYECTIINPQNPAVLISKVVRHLYYTGGSSSASERAGRYRAAGVDADGSGQIDYTAAWH